MSEASKIISSAIIGYDVEIVVVAGKRYVIQPPTIHKMSGAIFHLSDVELKNADSLGTVKSFMEFIISLKDSIEQCTKALSWLVKGDDSIYEELSHGAPDEIVEGLIAGFSMIDESVFLKAATLAKNVAKMAANPK